LTLEVIVECNILAATVVDGKHMYTNKYLTGKTGHKSGFFYTDLHKLVKNFESPAIFLDDAIAGVTSLITFSKDVRRLVYVKDYG